MFLMLTQGPGGLAEAGVEMRRAAAPFHPHQNYFGISPIRPFPRALAEHQPCSRPQFPLCKQKALDSGLTRGHHVLEIPGLLAGDERFTRSAEGQGWEEVEERVVSLQPRWEVHRDMLPSSPRQDLLTVSFRQSGSWD